MSLIGYQDNQLVLGKSMSYLEFKSIMETVETYHESSHDTRALKKDSDGQLWLYDLHEEMSFSGPDQIYEHFFKVDSAEQAEKYKDKHMLELKTSLRPFLHIGAHSYEIVSVGF